MAAVFLSYAREDEAFAKRIAQWLGESGIAVWWDNGLLGGQNFRKAIGAELAAASAVVVLWSRHSVSSDWVLDEAQMALLTNRLVPVSLDGTQPPLGFGQLHTNTSRVRTARRPPWPPLCPV